LLVILGLLAHLISTSPLESRLQAGGSAALELNGAGSANLAMSGRDAILSGSLRSSDAVRKAASAVALVYGIRRVDASAMRVAIPAPMINPLKTKDADAIIAGNWSPYKGNSLRVTYADTTYVLGSDPEITTDADGLWRLTPRGGLKTGEHLATAIVSDDAGSRSDEAQATITRIELLPPGSPEITSIGSAEFGKAPVLGGAWPEGGGNILEVRIGNKTYRLGRDEELTSDGSGKWVLRLSAPLEEEKTPAQPLVTSADGLMSRGTEKIIQLRDTLPPRLPVVFKYTGEKSQPELRGTWDQSDAISLRVAVGGKTFELGNTPELQSDASGNWTLKAPELEPGLYDVAVETRDAAGNQSIDATRDEVSILQKDIQPPKPPAVFAYKGDDVQPEISGTWDQPDAVSLRVTVSGKTFELGRDSELTSETTGLWKLVGPRPGPGIHDVIAETADAKGNISRDETKDEIQLSDASPSVEVMTPPMPPVPVRAACLDDFGKVVNDRSLYFRINSSDIRDEIVPLLDDIAVYARTCPAAKFRIGGHTDSSGTRRHNDALSQRRTKAIIHALEKRGVEAGRAVPVEWFGETRPAATNGSRAGRQKNRRVEIFVAQ